MRLDPVILRVQRVRGRRFRESELALDVGNRFVFTDYEEGRRREEVPREMLRLALLRGRGVRFPEYHVLDLVGDREVCSLVRAHLLLIIVVIGIGDVSFWVWLLQDDGKAVSELAFRSDRFDLGKLWSPERRVGRQPDPELPAESPKVDRELAAGIIHQDLQRRFVQFVVSVSHNQLSMSALMIFLFCSSVSLFLFLVTRL